MIGRTQFESASGWQFLGSRFFIAPFGAIAFFISLQVPIAYPLEESDARIVHRVESLGGNVAFNSLSLDGTSNWLGEKVEKLTNLTNEQSIRTVFLKNTDIPDDVFSEFQSLRDLEQLFILDCKVTDKGLANLKSLAGLTWLNLGGTNVKDSDMKHLKGITKLRVLTLTDTQISDAALTHFKEMKNLEELYLGMTNITDEGLKDLYTLKNLKRIGLFKTKVTADAIEMLKKELPDCAIFLP